jgi:hypothetical protein
MEWTRKLIHDGLRQKYDRLYTPDLPTVRCRFDGREADGRIGIYTRNWPFVECRRPDGKWKAFTVSWSLLLAVLNDPRESPIEFTSEECDRFWSRIRTPIMES